MANLNAVVRYDSAGATIDRCTRQMPLHGISHVSAAAAGCRDELFDPETIDGVDHFLEVITAGAPYYRTDR